MKIQRKAKICKQCVKVYYVTEAIFINKSVLAKKYHNLITLNYEFLGVYE